MQVDCEVAYEQNVTGLEKSWAERIEARGNRALDAFLRAESNANRYDADGRSDWHDVAKEAIETMLFDSPQWENVEATDISDIAYEAAENVVRER